MPVLVGGYLRNVVLRKPWISAALDPVACLRFQGHDATRMLKSSLQRARVRATLLGWLTHWIAMSDSPTIPVPSPTIPLQLDEPVSPRSSARKEPKNRASYQRWTSPKALAAFLGYAHVTVLGWIARGKVIAARVSHHRHYTDDRQRATNRGQWRIHEDDVMELLAHMRQGKTIRSFGRGFWRGGKGK